MEVLSSNLLLSNLGDLIYEWKKGKEMKRKEHDWFWVLAPAKWKEKVKKKGKELDFS